MPGQKATDSLLPPELAQRREQFDALKQSARDLTDGLSDAQINWQPAPGSWSIGQCLSHLNVAGFLIVRRMEDAIENAHSNGLYSSGPFRYGMLGKWFVRSMQPDAWLRFPAPAPYMPTSDHRREVIVPRFVELQENLIAAVENANGLDLQRITIVSPVSRLIRFNLGTWFAATEAHERRHLAQARRVRDAADFPG